MPINRTYVTWKARILELRPRQRITQIRAFTWREIGCQYCGLKVKQPNQLSDIRGTKGGKEMRKNNYRLKAVI